MTGQLMLKGLFPTKVLPVGIFYPLGNYRFIALIIERLEIVQSHHQPTWQWWSSPFAGRLLAEFSLQIAPIDRLAELDQWMFQIQMFLQ